ncbi:MAG: hypothetical protein ACXVCS_20305, partial [Bdellovibrionota bacterium]
MRTNFFLKILPFLALLPACAKVDSTQVKSGGIYSTYSVTADPSGAANCEAVFQVGSPTGTYLSLQGADTVTCDGQPMTKSEVLGIITYSAKVSYDLNKTYTLIFHRDNEPDYKSDMSLPEPITLISPATGDRLSGANGVELKWALGNSIAYDMNVDLSGPTESTIFASEYPDKGSKLLPADSLKLPNGSTAENFTATVTRSRAGSFPQGLAGGRSHGR